MFLIYSIRENEDRYEEAHHLYNRILRHFSSAAASAYTKLTYFLGNRTAAFSGGANAEKVRRHDNGSFLRQCQCADSNGGILCSAWRLGPRGTLAPIWSS